MKPHVSGITLGVKDLNRAKQFYSTGLGWPIHQGEWVSFSLNNGSFTLGLLPRESTCRRRWRSCGRQPFLRHHVLLYRSLRREERVDAVLAEAKRAGGQIAKPAQRASWGGYFGYFTDPDGYLWKVAAGAGDQPSSAE